MSLKFCNICSIELHSENHTETKMEYCDECCFEMIGDDLYEDFDE